jgi:hypothetical protein
MLTIQHPVISILRAKLLVVAVIQEMWVELREVELSCALLIYRNILTVLARDVLPPSTIVASTLLK